MVLFGIIQGVLIALFFAVGKRSKDHKYVRYFLMVLLMVQLHSYLVRSGLMSQAIFFLNTNVPLIFLFGPLIYFYYRDLRGKPIQTLEALAHLLPFLFYMAYSFNFFLQDEAFKFNVLLEILSLDLERVAYKKSFPSDPWNIQGWVVVEVLSTHLLCYGLFSLFQIIRKREVNDELSRSRRQWIGFLNMMLILGGLILMVSEGGVINGKVFFQSPFPSFSGDLFGTFAMYCTTLYIFLRPGFLKSSPRKYSKSSLSRDFMKKKLRVIQKTIEETKLYLDPDFSLGKLSKSTGLGKHHISQIINEELNCNFFDLTNHYRIEEAKRVLKESEHIKMEQLAYQLGYKSKSSFFNAFKKATDRTPSKYHLEAC